MAKAGVWDASLRLILCVLKFIDFISGSVPLFL